MVTNYEYKFSMDVRNDANELSNREEYVLIIHVFERGRITRVEVASA